MRANRVEHLIHANRPDLLRLLRLLNEDLLVQVVPIVSHKSVRLLKKQHNIDSLVELLGGQMRRLHRDAQLVVS